MGEPTWVASSGCEAIACVNDRRVHAVLGLYDPSSRRNDVELERPHGRRAASSAPMGVTLET
jgi:hypothetical protein